MPSPRVCADCGCPWPTGGRRCPRCDSRRSARVVDDTNWTVVAVVVLICVVVLMGAAFGLLFAITSGLLR